MDSTSDISHTDQLTFIIRYILPDEEPVERFITFLPNCGHKGEDIEVAVLATIDKTFKHDIKDCRGKSYDNASNMSGQYKGLQSRIKAVNPLATFVPSSSFLQLTSQLLLLYWNNNFRNFLLNLQADGKFCYPNWMKNRRY